MRARLPEISSAAEVRSYSSLVEVWVRRYSDYRFSRDRLAGCLLKPRRYFAIPAFHLPHFLNKSHMLRRHNPDLSGKELDDRSLVT